MFSRFIRKFYSVGGGEFIQKVENVKSFLKDYKGVAVLTVTVASLGFAGIGYYLKKEFVMVDLNMEKQFDKVYLNMEKKFDMVDKKFELIDKKFEMVFAKLESIDKKLDTLIIDVRSYSKETNERILKLEIDKGVRDELKRLERNRDVSHEIDNDIGEVDD